MLESYAAILVKYISHSVLYKRRRWGPACDAGCDSFVGPLFKTSTRATNDVGHRVAVSWTGAACVRSPLSVQAL